MCCHLALYDSDAEFDSEGFLRAAKQNDDGHSFTIADAKGGRIHTFKSWNAEEVAERFIVMRRKYKGPAMTHSRWASQGPVVEKNIHPFRVGRDKRTFLAHNGHLSGICTPLKGDTRTDSGVFAAGVMGAMMPGIDDPKVRLAVEDFLSGSKVVILTVNPHYKRNFYILNEKRGTWRKGGYWTSNDDDLPSKWGNLSYGSAGWEGTTSSRVYGWDCEVCGARLPVVGDTCEACLACTFCLGNVAATDGLGCACHEDDKVTPSNSKFASLTDAQWAEIEAGN